MVQKAGTETALKIPSGRDSQRVQVLIFLLRFQESEIIMCYLVACALLEFRKAQMIHI